jgi:signal transduction histidine kinase
MIEADPNKLRDVVVNLLSNAIKFSPDGSELAISANSADDECVIIRVIDHGIGADAQVLSRMFEPFFTQLDTSTHSTGDFGFRKRGMGLGLSLVRRFVELHGGTVRAESEPGKGTVVIVRWPRRPPASSMLESTGSPSGTGS